MIRILLADDHQILREGLKSLISKEADMQVIAEAADGREALESLSKFRPDVAVLDVSMPRLNGIEAAQEMRRIDPGVKIIALSMHNDRRFIKKMLESGATAYLLKNCAAKELVLAIRSVRAGSTFLSQGALDTLVGEMANPAAKAEAEAPDLSLRERETLKLIAEGKTTKEIAAELGLSVKSIEAYRKQLMEKLELQSVADLIKFAIREGLTEI